MLTRQIHSATGCSLARCFSAAHVWLARASTLVLLILGCISGQAGAQTESVESEFDSWWTQTKWRYTTGLDYSRGDYGLTEDTEIIYVPISVEADFFPMRARIMLPFLSIDGPTGVLPGGGGTVSGTTRGLGQLVGSFGYLWMPPSQALPYLEFTGKVTAPTETSEDLGNGAWAFSLQVDPFKSFGRLLAFGRLGRKFYTGGTSDDRFYASVGASFRLHERYRLGVAYDWYQASTDSVQDTHELSPYFGIKIGKHWSISPYGLIGLSDGAPDLGMGVTLSVRP